MCRFLLPSLDLTDRSGGGLDNEQFRTSPPNKANANATTANTAPTAATATSTPSIKSISIQTSPAFTANSRLLAKKQKKRNEKNSLSKSDESLFESGSGLQPVTAAAHISALSPADQFAVVDAVAVDAVEEGTVLKASEPILPIAIETNSKSANTATSPTAGQSDDYIEASWETGISLEDKDDDDSESALSSLNIDTEIIEQLERARVNDGPVEGEQLLKESDTGTGTEMNPNNVPIVREAVMQTNTLLTEGVNTERVVMANTSLPLSKEAKISIPPTVSAASDLQDRLEKSSTLGDSTRGANSPAATGNQSVKPNNLMDGINVPDKNLVLERVYGYYGDCVGNNLTRATRDELAYFTAAIVVIWNPKTNSQRFYLDHTEDIEWSVHLLRLSAHCIAECAFNQLLYSA